jgi:uncharacterized ion transporter superfamily protein YfcC
VTVEGWSINEEPSHETEHDDKVTVKLVSPVQQTIDQTKDEVERENMKQTYILSMFQKNGNDLKWSVTVEGWSINEAKSSWFVVILMSISYMFFIFCSYIEWCFDVWRDTYNQWINEEDITEPQNLN